MPKLYLPGRELELEGVGLDVDGLLRDTGYSTYEATCQTIAEYGGLAPSYSDYVRDFHYDFLGYYRGCGATLDIDQLMATFEKHCPAVDESRPFDDVGEFLESVRGRGLKIFTVSAHPAEKLHAWFTGHGLDDHFLHLAGGSRNKVDCIRRSCRELGLDPSKTFYAGDRGVDIREAREAGATAVGVTRGYPAHDGLSAAGADLVVDHLSELAAIIR